MAHATAHPCRTRQMPSGRTLRVWELEHDGVWFTIDNSGNDCPYFWTVRYPGGSVMNSASTFGEAHEAAIEAAGSAAALRAELSAQAARKRCWSCLTYGLEDDCPCASVEERS